MIDVPRGRKYDHDQTVVELYGPPGHPERIKVTTYRSLRAAGVEVDEPPPQRGTNDAKLAANIARAKAAILALGSCNDWDYFATLTIAPEWGDRTDLQAYWRSLSRWLRRRGCTYLLVPERHADGRAWHMHGLLRMDSAQLTPHDPAGRLPDSIRSRLAAGRAVYDWPDYRETYGWCDVEPVLSRDAAAAYMTKYATKDLARSVTELGAHSYYASQGLHRPERAMRGTLTEPVNIPLAYSTDYIRVHWAPYSPELLQQLQQQIV